MSDPSPARRAITYLALDEIIPADRNPKRHDHETLSASFRRFGFVEPIIRDDRTGKLVAGHGRVDELRMARARAADAPPPGVVLDDDGTWRVPVVSGWASANDAEAQAYVIASNRAVELGGWDESILTDALADLEQLGDQAFAGVGYSLDDALAMMSARLGEIDNDDLLDARPQIEGLSYRVIVDCDDEQHQAAVLEQLDALGLSVRAVVN
jgi:ParB-like chromosome segregation protein Spo0J